MKTQLNNNQVMQLRSMIRVALQHCDRSVTPNFCQMLSSPESYKKAESMVLNYAIKNEVSIGAAISQLESEMT
ncbi:hypothetical protein JMN32_05185 [Fulvivirga sp. 29W222]|uniref:Uncharacterized protein n=1 Tax=Fulvivirga marina TaxID=2494733 RepID=A0A937FZE0_9BACT|nr:hypothetical protein [Fulvivirga marina]MBL6445691.1 hypothetical protein [Fulvivirga marina]